MAKLVSFLLLAGLVAAGPALAAQPETSAVPGARQILPRVSNVNVYENQPDFHYSPAAAQWVSFRSWEPRRFFCIMGRSAAALVLVSEGEQAKKLYRDMPKPSKAECELVQKHMGELLKAGNDVVQEAGRTKETGK